MFSYLLQKNQNLDFLRKPLNRQPATLTLNTPAGRRVFLLAEKLRFRRWRLDGRGRVLPLPHPPDLFLCFITLKTGVEEYNNL